MSRINKYRFVNLNYNNNSMKIDDESFFLDCENTMFNLRNGGGKSVLVQMMMAPFVHKRYRDFKDRPFESYFTSNIPTYIMAEWKLENEAGYVLTGMMVRKREVQSDEDSKEKLDIINFISEYRIKNNCDIDSLKIVEEINGHKAVKSYANAKKLFEELKKNPDVKFSYFDMSNSATSKAYFDKLLTYKINYKEWENVIKKINLKESGLSELFANAKNVEGLMKEWFLPAIENKLNKDEDRIKNFREIISDYILQYKENKHSIDKKAKMELFCKLSGNLYDECDKYIETIEKREELENVMANDIAYLKQSKLNYESEQQELDKDCEALNDALKELMYEEKSLEIYEEEDKRDDIERKLEDLKNYLDSLKSKKEELSKKLNVLRCAKIHKEYMERSQECQDYENRLKVLNSRNKDFAPRINDLGYSIKSILTKELLLAENEQHQNEDLKKSLIEEKKKIEISIEDNNKTIRAMSKDEGDLSSSIRYFDKEQDSFNKKYNENLIRNIEGYFNDHDIFELDKEITDSSAKFEESKKAVNENIFELEEELKSVTRQKETASNKSVQIDRDLKYKNEQAEKYDEDIEKRKEIIKYVDLNESYVFDTDKIRELFYRKIADIKEEENKLRILLEKKKEELLNLESGKVLKLPKDVEKELKKRDINIIYGMDWLRSNSYSEAENKRFIERNPFIPYSLVMNESDINVLKDNPINCYTSAPISIIRREKLTDSLKDNSEIITSINGVEFLISFNDKLLNQKELKNLINSKKDEIVKIENDISVKEDSIMFYEEKKNIIEKSDITLEKYNNLKETIKSLKDELDNTKSDLITYEKKRQEINSKINDGNNEIKKLEKEIERYKNKREAYDNLIASYNIYKENKQKLDNVKDIISACKNSISNLKKDKDKNEESSRECDEKIIHNRENIKAINDDMAVYNMYTSGNIIEKDTEDLKAEYASLTKKISESENELKEKIKISSKKFKDTELELIAKSKKYGIKDSEYTAVLYDVYKENEAEDNLSLCEKDIVKTNDDISPLNGELKFINKTLTKCYKDLKNNFGYDTAKDRSLIFNKNYKEEEASVEFKIKNNRQKSLEVADILSKISSSLSSVSEYGSLLIKENIDTFIKISDLDETLGKLKRDLSKLKEDESKNENSLQRAVYKVQINDEFKDEVFFKEPIDTLLAIVSKPYEFKEQLTMLNDSYNKLMEKLSYDIELIEKEEANVLENLLDYIKTIHENISKLDDNSSITIKDKRIKMLNIIVPEWQENDDLYKVKLREYIEQLRNQCVITLENNESIEELISNNINTSKLYDEVVSLSTINIKLYKIEEDKQRPISWNEVSSNSGGEGFLSAFVILSSLLSYMRKDDSDVFSRREEGKVLIMDNPFAQTNAAHLLKPLMEVAKKSNTQLICLTGLGGDSIYNRFDNIYVLKLISSKIKSGMKYLKGEHAKGNDEAEYDIEMMESSRFKIEDMEQTRLF